MRAKARTPGEKVYWLLGPLGLSAAAVACSAGVVDGAGGESASVVDEASSDGAGRAQRARMWVTTGDGSKRFAFEGTAPIQGAGAGGAPVVRVDPSVAYQEMEGFGAALTDSAAWLLQNRLSPAQRADVMAKLFSADGGIRLSYLRLPLGASDFALRHYTFDDTCCSLGDFSIERDRAYVLPLARQARALNPDLKYLGTPWSAPAWMKDSGSLTTGKLLGDQYAAYADYLRKAVEAYAREGVPLAALTVQNEPQHEPGTYPGMRFEWFDELNFVRVLGPKMAGSGVKLLTFDHNWDMAWYPKASMNESGREFYAGSAWHCYGGAPGAMSEVHDAHPDKDVYFTECSGGGWATNFGDNVRWYAENLIIGAPRNWAKTVLFWNLALDPAGNPHAGGCENCRGVVTVDQNTGAVTYNEEYYALAHVSKFVRPGARRVRSDDPTADVLSVAFRNPSGELVAVVLNKAGRAQTVRVEQGGRSFAFAVPAGSLATFVW
jgi:glucosylceramidase